MKQPLIFLVIIALLIGSFYLAFNNPLPSEPLLPVLSLPTATPSPTVTNSNRLNWSIFNSETIGMSLKYPSSVTINLSSQALTSNDLSTLESWYLDTFTNHQNTFIQEMEQNPSLNSTQLSGRQIISVGVTSVSGIYSIDNYFFTPGQITTLKINYGPQPTGISPDFENQTFELNRQILSSLSFSSQASISSNLAIEITNQIPEISREIARLSKENIKTVFYAEKVPTDNDPTFKIYFGENSPGHNNRLASIIIDSFSGQMAFVQLPGNKVIFYREWQKVCQLKSCQK